MSHSVPFLKVLEKKEKKKKVDPISLLHRVNFALNLKKVLKFERFHLQLQAVNRYAFEISVAIEFFITTAYFSGACELGAQIIV